MNVVRFLSALGWLSLVVALTQAGCGNAPVALPSLKAPDAADVYKAAMTACLACALPNLPPAAAKGCADLAPVCDALAGVCEEGSGGAAP